MASTSKEDGQPSIGSLVQEATKDFSTVLRGEIELAKLELTSTVKYAGAGAGFFVGAVVLVLFSLTFGLIALAERADQVRDVGRQVRGVVAARRLVARPVATQVDRDGPKPRVGEVDELLMPRPPELREAVQHQHERSGTHLGDVQGNPVCAHHPVRPGTVYQHDRIVRRGRRRGSAHWLIMRVGLVV